MEKENGLIKTTQQLVIWVCLGLGIAEGISPRSQLGQEGGRVEGPKVQRFTWNPKLVL